MTMKLDNLDNFQEKKQAYANLVTAGADEKEQAAAYSDMMDALQGDLSKEISTKVNEKLDTFEANRRVDPKITANEVKFFNELTTDTSNKNEIILPEETINQIFDDLTSEHPFLAALNLQTTGIRLKFLKSDTNGAAVWGKVFDEIKGQLDQVFTEEDATQSKLTAFVAVPNDALEYGAAWLKQFVVTQITETFASALEEAFLIGDGNQKPIGLNRQVQKGVAVTAGAYPEKDATVKFEAGKAIEGIAAVVKALSVKENGKPVVATGNTVLAVRPGANIDLQAAYSMQNVNGEWVFALPFGVQVVESQFVPEGKAIAFVKGRYDAYTAGNVTIKEFDQTLALEDMTLYTSKQFAYGKAKDNNAAVVVDLSALSATPSTSTPA